MHVLWGKHKFSYIRLPEDDICYVGWQDGKINYDEFAAMMRKGNPDMAGTARRRK